MKTRMKKIGFTGLTAILGLMAAMAADPIREGNIPTRTVFRTNYLRGVTHTGSNGLSSLFSAAEIVQPPVSNTLYVSSSGNDASAVKGSVMLPWKSFTNAAALMSAGDKVEVLDGFHQPTNTISFAKAGGPYFFKFHAGKYAFGANGDDTAVGSRPLWSDAAGASEVYILGEADFVISNKTSSLVRCVTSGSKFVLQCNSAWRGNTNVNTATLYQQNGEFYWRMRYLRNDGYDGFLPETGSPVFGFSVDEIAVVDTTVECNSSTGAGFGYVGKLTKLPSVDPNLTQFIKINDGVHIKVAQPINLGTNGQINSGFGAGTGILEVGRVTYTSGHRTPLASVAAMTFLGTTFDAHALTDTMMLIGDNVTLIGCGFIGAATNSISAFSDRPLKVRGDLYREKPLGPLVFPDRMPVISKVLEVDDTSTVDFTVSDVLVRKLATSGAKSIILTNASYFGKGARVRVKDGNGTASNASSNIIVKAATGTIDGVAGATGKTINTDWGVYRLITDGTNWFSL